MRKNLRLTAFLALIWLLISAGIVFAADNLASTLWTPDELKATAAEKKPGPREKPDLSGPSGQVELAALPGLPQALHGSLRRVQTNRKLVALTFDLCELTDMRAGYDGQIVDYLRENALKATFFAGGRWMRSHPLRSMQLMATPGFEIANHAWTHGNFGVLSEAGMREQAIYPQRQYALLRAELAKLVKQKGLPDSALAQVPAQPTLFRFPYGRCRPEALQLLAKLGLAAVQWDVNSQDADKTRSAEAIVKGVLAKVKPGSIVLCHANGFGHNTAQALPELVQGLKRAGYELVTVSELLQAGTPEAKSECYADNPGDTAIYDQQYGDGTMHSWSRGGAN